MSKTAEATLLIGGDVFPGNRYIPLFKAGNIDAVFYDLVPEFENADFSIVNLECPLIAEKSPIVKSGPALHADRECINALADLGLDLASLANNHIMDHGEAGLLSTLAACREKGIATTGAGADVHEAAKIYETEINGLRIGVMSFAENEFSIATETLSGAAPLDIVDNARQILRCKEELDYLIVLFHGGNEHYQYPSPRLQKECQFLIDMGADTVLVQHTHCVGSYESYKNGHILYGQGNFIFDRTGKDAVFYEGLLIKLKVSPQGAAIEFIPFVRNRDEIGVRKMKGAEAERFFNGFENRSRQTEDPVFLKKNWQSYCSGKKYEYLSYLLGHNKIKRILAATGCCDSIFLSDKLYTSIRNIVICESHHDVLRQIFQEDVQDRRERIVP